MRFAVGVALSDAADGDGDGGASEAALTADGLDSLDAADARVPRNAADCFSRYDDMVSEGRPQTPTRRPTK